MICIGKKDRLLRDNLRTSFSKIKDEFADHLEAINENTNEINANYEYLLELDMKIEKLNEKVEELCMMLSEGKEKSYTSDIYLTSKEQELFMVLYAQNGNLMDYRGLSKMLGITEEMVERMVTSIILKGIPVIKRYKEDRTYISLDEEFRNAQAKGNIIKINPQVRKKLHL